ncbi:C-C motif chemokine 15 [Saimiri boliviensis]|uniref:C-C motif chemokine 15 n=1 Tax=Saimiri boliviensis TaxID=27679 RepID=UPI000533D9B9|nr:C-C motif chemokine 15-like [Saimiri boliviensis boliviensis]
MKVSVAALSCLVLVAALGSQARVINDAETESVMSELPLEYPLVQKDAGTEFVVSQVSMEQPAGLTLPADCCFHFPRQTVRCSLMNYYFETGNKCPRPAVIFLSKSGQRICTKLSDTGVQECMRRLTPYPNSHVREPK